ncbi:hypothetical protein GCM10027168_70630 [Streptomyces capparidis]
MGMAITETAQGVRRYAVERRPQVGGCGDKGGDSDGHWCMDAV